MLLIPVHLSKAFASLFSRNLGNFETLSSQVECFPSQFIWAKHLHPGSQEEEKPSQNFDEGLKVNHKGAEFLTLKFFNHIQWDKLFLFVFANIIPPTGAVPRTAYRPSEYVAPLGAPGIAPHQGAALFSRPSLSSTALRFLPSEISRPLVLTLKCEAQVSVPQG